MRKAILVLAVLALVPGLVLAGPPAGSPAPNFNLPDTAYNYHRLSDFLGSVVLLNFWQST